MEDLFVQDLYGGSQPGHRVRVRVVNDPGIDADAMEPVKVVIALGDGSQPVRAGSQLVVVMAVAGG